MKNKSNLKKILIVVIILETIVILGYYLLFSKIIDKNKNISFLKNNLAMQIDRQQYMLSMRKNFRSTDSDITKINQSIVDKEEDVSFIENIENIARRNNLSIKIESLYLKNDPSFPNDLVILSARITIVGGWQGLYSFLNEIESLPTKIKINKLAITKNMDAQNDSIKIGDWQGVFEINVLKYK